MTSHIYELFVILWKVLEKEEEGNKDLKPLKPGRCVNVSEGLLIVLSSSGLCNVFWQTDSCELWLCLSVSDQLYKPLPSTTVSNTDTQTHKETRNIYVRETLTLPLPDHSTYKSNELLCD